MSVGNNKKEILLSVHKNSALNGHPRCNVLQNLLKM